VTKRAFSIKMGGCWSGGTDSPDWVASRHILGASASITFPCTVKSRKWRAVMEEVDKGCSEFCLTDHDCRRTDP